MFKKKFKSRFFGTKGEIHEKEYIYSTREIKLNSKKKKKTRNFINCIWSKLTLPCIEIFYFRDRTHLLIKFINLHHFQHVNMQ